jgi:hypothetical protein
MSTSSEPSTVRAPAPTSRLGRQVLGAVAGAIVGAVLWWLLSVPSHLIQVIWSTLVGAGAGLAAGRLSGATRSVAGTVLTVLVTLVVILVTMSLITRSYLTWATGRLPNVPSNTSWDGPVGGLRLALDRAAGRNGWSRNASYFWWTLSLGLAATLSWCTARRPGTTAP